MSNVTRLYQTLPDLITPGFSAVSAVPRSARHSMAMPVAFAVRPGYGRSEPSACSWSHAASLGGA